MMPEGMEVSMEVMRGMRRSVRLDQTSHAVSSLPPSSQDCGSSVALMDESRMGALAYVSGASLPGETMDL